MISTNDFSVINALDLEPIKQRLMNRSGAKGWTPERADAVEREYRRFLCLVKIYRDAPLAPVIDVDEFWHYHILDTKKYAADCERVFGYFLHHFPYAGMRGKEDEEARERIATRTRAMYEKTFGIEYMADLAAVGGRPTAGYSAGVRLSTAYGAPAAETAFCYVAQARMAGDDGYCYVTETKAAESVLGFAPDAKAAAEAAFCFAPDAKANAEAAFCFAPDAKANAEAAFCFAPDAKAAHRVGPSAARTLDERASFYLERPRLPAS
jgi:hypothetical protein